MHQQVEDQPSEKPKKNGDTSAVAILKHERQSGSVFQDTEPPESVTILRKSAKVLGPIRRVDLSKATQRHANIRENKGPSLGIIVQPILTSVALVRQNLRTDLRKKRRDKSDVPAETRGDWPKSFFSPTDDWCLPAPSVIKL